MSYSVDDYAMFRQALRGFDKDEVLAYIRSKEEEHAKACAAYEKDIRKRDKIISELKSRVVLKDEQVDRLEEDIRNRYQKYIDNYRQIGDLVYESKVKSEQIVGAARREAEEIVRNAGDEAAKKVASVQGQIDAKLNDGRKKYLHVQDEMNEIVDMFNKMQKKFMQSYKEVHEIIQSMPASLSDIKIDSDEPLILYDSEEDFDDEDMFDDEEFDTILDFTLDEDPDDDDTAPYGI